tara:strand:+ start:3530 stop:6349 length:2820 start_codon:yes stop_codon:yes gene_type:complete
MKKQILTEINRTKEIMGLLNEDWWGRLWGGKKRREDIYDILKAGVEWKKTNEWIEDSDRKKTPPVFGEGELRMFAKIVNKLDRIFVDESSVIKYLKGEAKYMGLDELDTLTQIAFKDSDKENKPEKFVDLLVLSGNFDEGEKYNLDQNLETTLSKLKQEQLALRGGDKVCPWANDANNMYTPGDNPKNPYDKETEADIWKWCEAKRKQNQSKEEKEKYNKDNVKPASDKDGSIGAGENVRTGEKEEGTKENPFGATPRVSNAEEGKYYRNNKNKILYLVKDGKYVKINKEDKVEESHHLNEINRVREIMGLKPIMEQKIGSKVTRDGKRYKIVDLIKEKLPKTNIGQTFASAVYKLSDKSLDAVEELAKKMVDFFSAPDLKRIKFEIDLEGGASLVPLQASKAKSMGMPGWQDATVDERNMWLAEKRTEAVKTYLENALDTAGIDNVTIPEPTVTLGTTAWDTTKGAHHDDYTDEQFMNVSFKATGTREVLEALPAFCKKKFEPEAGGQGGAPEYKIYPGEGMQLNLGGGTGKITLQFNAMQVPDKFILTYAGEEYVSSNPDTGVEGFVSALFRKMSQKDLELVKPKLEKITLEVEKLETEIVEAQAIIDSTTEDQALKITAKLEQEEENLKLAIIKIKEKIKTYGFSIPIGLGWNGKYKKQGEKWGPYIEHYLDFPNRTAPNVYWFVHKDDDVSDKLVRKRDGGNQTQEEYKTAQYLGNAFYNLKREEELDDKWFTNFFKLYPYDNKSEVKKSTGYKKLVTNRNKKQTGFKKDDLKEFFAAMRKLQAIQLKDQKKELKNMNAEIPAKKKEIAQRKIRVNEDLQQELKIILNEINVNKKRIEKLLKNANITKKEYDWNVKTGGDAGPKGYYNTRYYNKQLEDAGFDDGIIGPNGEITFDKIEGQNVAYLQVVAPLGGTLWDLNIKCGKDNANRPLTKPA